MKRFLLFASLCVLCFSVFVPPKASAAAVPLRLTAQGVKVLTGIGAKAGIKHGSRDAAEVAAKRWNLDLYNEMKKMDEESKAFYNNVLNRMNTADVVEIPSKPGWGKVLVDAALFATGADMLLEGYNHIQKRVNEKKFVDAMAAGTGFNPDVHLRSYGILNDWVLLTREGVVQYMLGTGTFNDSTSKTFTWNADNYDVDDLIDNYFAITGSTVIAGQTVLNVFVTVVTTDMTSQYQGTYTLPNKMTEADLVATAPAVEAVKYPGPTVPLSIPDIIGPYVNPPGISAPGATPIPVEVPDLVEIEIPLGDNWNPDEVYENNPVGDLAPAPEPVPDPNADPGKNPVPEAGPDPGKDLNPEPEAEPVPETESPIPKPPDGTVPESPQGCKPQADDLLGLFINFLVGDIDCINWSKLRQAGGFYTNKFPFSIPWDVGRALTATFGGLNTDGEPPVFKLKIKDFETDISVPEEFHPWFKIFRGFILIMFDLGLVWSVRKMLGGAQ